MAETEINVVNRPGAILSTIVSVWPLVLACITAGVWLLHLEGTTTENQRSIVRIEAGNTERDAKWSADQSAQNARVDRIEESRTTGLQRLATVEEAVKGQNRTLDAISTKLDRLLMGGRGR